MNEPLNLGEGSAVSPPMTTSVRASRGWRVAGVALAGLALILVLVAARGAVAGAEPTAHASVAGAKVTIKDFAFHPSTLRVAPGTRVVFANRSNVTHTATRQGLNTGRIKPGKSVALTFKQKGTFAYHCMIHPFMHGKVVVG
jgi:plastocyanin